MTEGNSNTNIDSFQSNLDSEDNTIKDFQEPIQPVESVYSFEPEEKNSASGSDINFLEQEQSLEQKMNWQKVAHKLREYNRKLLKKVFRLEQELAEIDNRFNKYIEKSRNSDLLVAQQEAEIQKYQEQIAELDRQIVTSQETIDRQEISLGDLSQLHQSSLQQTALLERECTLLKEQYEEKNAELMAKTKEAKELQIKLNHQQRSVWQYKAELKRYQEKAAIPKAKSSSEISLKKPQSNSSRRAIQPWSTPPVANSKISLPKTRQATINRAASQSETVKTAAEIATWSASQIQEKSTKEKQKAKATSKPATSTNGKPQTLAAVNLPTFPRPL